MAKTVQPRQPDRYGQALKREDDRLRHEAESGIAGGRLVGLTNIAPGTTKAIAHGLGRLPTGYMICRIRANAAISNQIRDVGQMSDKFIRLANDSAVTVAVSLWVF